MDSSFTNELFKKEDVRDYYPKHVRDIVKDIRKVFPGTRQLKGEKLVSYQYNQAKAGNQELEFSCKVHLEIDRTNLKDGSSMRLQVEQWEVNGRLMGSPKLALREYYSPKNGGEDKPGKAKGMSYSDVQTVMKHLSEIEEALAGRPLLKKVITIPNDDEIPF